MLLLRANFSSSHSVFKRLALQTRKNKGLFGKGLNLSQTSLCTILLKILWEKEKLFILSNISTVFSALLLIFLLFSFNLKLSSANSLSYRSLKFVIWERVNVILRIWNKTRLHIQYSLISDVHKENFFQPNRLSNALFSFSLYVQYFPFMYCYLTHSLIHHLQTIPNSKKLQTTTEMWLLKFSRFRLHRKYCGKTVKLLKISNFTFFHNVFLKLLSSMCYNEYIWKEGLTLSPIMTQSPGTTNLHRKPYLTL